MSPPRSFAWQGQDAQGRQRQGRLKAPSAGLARAQLRRQGVRPLRLQRLWWDRMPRVRPNELSLMTRQLAALLRAGVPLLQSLDMLSRSLPSLALSEVMQQVHMLSAAHCTLAIPACVGRTLGLPPART